MTSRSLAISRTRVGKRAEGLGSSSGSNGERPRRAQPGRAVRSTLTAAFAALSRPVRQPPDGAGRSVDRDLRRAEALGFAGAFCSAVAHEMSTPLNVISGRIALALRKLPPDSAARDDLKVMLAQTERVARIVRTALAPLRPPLPALSPTDPRDLLTSILPSVAQVAQALSVDLVVSFAEDTPRIQADATQLTRVITHMLVHALETTPTGHCVRLIGRSGRRGDRSVLEISITDGGPGLSHAVLAHVFDPLFLTQTSATGVSLALSAARDVLRGHGGELRVDSEPGSGTTITLELPVIEGESS